MKGATSAMNSTTLSDRRVAMVMYLCYLLAGVAFLFFPSTTLRHGASPVYIIVWHVFLILGSLIGIVGGLIKRPVTEAIGIPLLCASLLAYSLVLFVYAVAGDPGPRIGVGLLIFGAFVGAANRFVYVFRLLRIADEVQGKGSRKEPK